MHRAVICWACVLGADLAFRFHTFLWGVRMTCFRDPWSFFGMRFTF
jgi:hypothetical protein